MEEIIDECVSTEDLHSQDDINEEIEETLESESDLVQPLSQIETAEEELFQDVAVRNPRPKTATSRRDAGEGVSVPSKLLPIDWGVSDVTAWLERIGFLQYRRKFIHHSVNGAVLVELTDTQLKLDLGIGPLGHRFALLKAIEDLKQSNLYSQREAKAVLKVVRWSGTGCILGGSLFEEHCSRLQSKIERLETKITERRQWLDEGVMQLREDESHLDNLKSELRRLESHSQSTNHTLNHTLDQKGKVPWFPTGKGTCTRDLFPKQHPLGTDNRPGSSCSLNGSLEMRGRSFLERLNDDLTSRRNKAKLVEKAYLEKGRFKITEESLARDSALVRSSLSEMEGTQIEEDGLMEYLTEQLDIDQLQNHFELDSLQRERIERTRGSQKIVAIAGAIRTQRFMESYRMELQNRDSNLKTLKKKWFKETHKCLDSDEQQQKDLQGWNAYLSQLGWDPEAIQDDSLDSLIQRSMQLKEASDNQQPIHWATLKSGVLMMSSSQPVYVLREGLSHQLGGEKGDDTALEATMKLLSRVPLSDLQSFLDLHDDRKRSSLYRALRSQKFLQFVETDMDRRQEKIQQYWASCSPSKKVLSKEQVESFFERLIEDGIKRHEKRQQQIQDKIQKEDQAIRDMANRKFSRRPRGQARSRI